MAGGSFLSHKVESFVQNYPEELSVQLDCISLPTVCAFNNRGSLLAVGCNDGRIVIWDFPTRCILKIIIAHIHPIACLSWINNGTKLASGSSDCTLYIWNVITGECEWKRRFPTPILKLQWEPRNTPRHQLLVCPMRHAAVILQDDGLQHQIVPLDADDDLHIVASFDQTGEHVYTANGKGRVLIFATETLEVKASFRIVLPNSNPCAIKSIEFSQRGDCFLVNGVDRIIRIYDSKKATLCGFNGELEPIQKLQDLVNKSSWKKCCFSGDGEYVCGGSARQHSLYVWEKSVGSLVKILHGTKGELLLDAVWHPNKPTIASISAGMVYIWSQRPSETWSAFSPYFQELDENFEYEERESEFDLTDEDKSVSGNDDQNVDEDDVEEIDVVCCGDEDPVVYLPIVPEVQPENLQSEERQMDNNFKSSSSNGNKKRKAVKITGKRGRSKKMNF